MGYEVIIIPAVFTFPIAFLGIQLTLGHRLIFFFLFVSMLDGPHDHDPVDGLTNYCATAATCDLCLLYLTIAYVQGMRQVATSSYCPCVEIQRM